MFLKKKEIHSLLLKTTEVSILFIATQKLTDLFKDISPGGSDGKESTCNAGDLGSVPGSGTHSGEGNGNPLQYSCLENSMDREAWQATVHGVPKSRT